MLILVSFIIIFKNFKISGNQYCIDLYTWYFSIVVFLLIICLSGLYIPSFRVSLYFYFTGNPKSCDDTPDCLKNAIQASLPAFIRGIPEYGINSLDPFIINKLELLLPGGLKMEFRQGSSKGLKRCIVDSARYVDINIIIIITHVLHFEMLIFPSL